MKPELKIVKTRRDLKKFVLFPFDLKKEDPLWGPSLIGAEMIQLNRMENPALDHCETALILASRKGKIVGRIAGSSTIIISGYGIINSPVLPV